MNTIYQVNIINEIKLVLELYDHFYSGNISPGDTVQIVLKKDQRSGILTTGIVKRLLTKKTKHTRGIKVMLKDGQVGRVQKIVKKK